VWTHRSGRLLRFLPISALVISASDIRRRRAAGRSTRYLVPDAVHAYLEQHALWAPRDPAR
jgi:nicotinate-nucleotide adenylyltransferase